jgi:uncharacterized protein YodC (DUF2158 family)
MEQLGVGDLVVLASGSMRMVVETVDDGRVACVWCHEGAIGRDAFDARLLRRWEHREEEARPARDAARGDRAGPGKPRASDRDERPPRGKPGWDGKTREKKYFRKEG